MADEILDQSQQTPAGEQTTTPVETPEVKPVNEPTQTKNEDGTVSFTPTGDLAVDLSLEFFGKLGLTMESPELQEAGRGNFQYLEAKLAELGEKATGYERYVALAKEGQKRLSDASKAADEARRKDVYDAVGGEEEWKKIAEHVGKNATPEEKTEIRDALAQGGIVAKAVAQMLKNLHDGAPGTRKDPAEVSTRQPSSPQGSEKLTLTGYRSELNLLVAKYGSTGLDGTPEYAALRKKYAGVTA